MSGRGVEIENEETEVDCIYYTLTFNVSISYFHFLLLNSLFPSLIPNSQTNINQS